METFCTDLRGLSWKMAVKRASYCRRRRYRWEMRHDMMRVCIESSAERSNVKQVDDWLCPTPHVQTSATSTRRRSGSPAAGAVDRQTTGQRHRSADRTTGREDPHSDDDEGLTVDLLLVTLGVLLALLIVVGLASYCRAVRS